jgi:hypothetical protein
VTFQEGTTTLGTGTLSGGVATFTTAALAVGSHTITASYGGDGNFNASSVSGSASGSTTQQVNPAAMTVTAYDDMRVYGDANPSFRGAIVGLQNGDNISATYSSAATASTAAGTYGPSSPNAIVPALSDPNNRLSNYSVTINNGTLTVLKAPLTITADNQWRIYGAPNPTLTGSIVGLKNGDGITATYSTSAGTSSSVGSYRIVPTAVDSSPSTLSNYNVTLVPGVLTVSTKAVASGPGFGAVAANLGTSFTTVTLGVSAPAAVQQGSSVALTWTSAATPLTLSQTYQVMRAPVNANGTCGTFTAVGPTTTATRYVDTTTQLNQQYCYYVVAAYKGWTATSPTVHVNMS